jgi:hypothetical protein
MYAEGGYVTFRKEGTGVLKNIKQNIYPGKTIVKISKCCDSLFFPAKFSIKKKYN